MLRRGEVAAALGVHQVEAVVDDDGGLELADHGEQVFRIPVRPALAVLAGWKRVIEPDQVDGAVIREQLADLVLDVLLIDRELAALVEFRVFLVSGGALRVVAVDRIVRVGPVQQGIINADADAFGAEGVEPLGEQIPAAGRVGGFEIREGGVPQTETLVVFRGEHGVFHAGRLGHARPLARIVEIRVEQPEVFLIVLRGGAFIAHHPLVAGGQGVEPPVDEQPEAGLGPPLEAGVGDGSDTFIDRLGIW